MFRLSALAMCCLAIVVAFPAGATVQEKVHIAVASSLRAPVDAIITEFEQQFPNYDVTVAYVASGKLVAQVVHGAPYALLISAEPRYLEALYQRQLIQAEPVLLGFGELVLWHPHQRGDVATLIAAADYVALAQPSHAPYGQAAMHYLQDQLAAEHYANKLVYGENVAQAAHRVHVGAAEIGFVALSQIVAMQVPQSDYTRLASAPLLPQAIALTAHAGQHRGAQLLYDFMLADGSQQTLVAYGYAATK
ncbi:molybdate ABC transporter substrate-binding protein [Pseudidiomarina homiensis]|uniref:molybdate ABC transporter substrate-binding protein n=1 Tax=Pseudidiomarina homiensis TaxID=364198 RepID=UPI00215A8C62|nr:molybdate ABC transporter substrate-binding protein [Pseudidiomarina homiensis]